MADTAAVPSKAQQRAQRQRARILDAAQRCFIERGFHAAGMAAIAETAGMSPGLIYRYFENKAAIVLAIIERQLEERRRDIASLDSGPELSQRICELFACWQRGDDSTMNAALFLEMSAEATRDPKVAAALAQSDRIASAQFRDWLQQRADPAASADERDVQQRLLVLRCFIEGLAIRAVREPDCDVELIESTVRRLLPRLLAIPAE